MEWKFLKRGEEHHIRYKFSSKEYKVASESRLVEVRQTSVESSVTMHYYRNLLRLPDVEDYHTNHVLFFS